VLCAATVASATAHVVLEQATTPAGSSTRAVLRVGHGCDGAATTALRVRIPSGFAGVKPMPKPGWLLTLRREKLAQPYSSHGKTVTEDVSEVTWTAATPADALPDAWYDEFVLRGTAPAQAGLLWFKVLQSCGSASLDWAEVPAAGSAVTGLKAPAVPLEVLPGEHAGHAH